MDTELDLLNAARRMNKEALIKIFDQYSSALFQYALRLGGDPMLADHVVGDVFVKLLDQLSQGNGPRKNLRSYLYETTYHQMIDEARYAKRRAPLEAAALLRQDTHALFLNLENKILFKHILQTLPKALTEDQRNVIILRFLEGFSVHETAAIMGKNDEHVKVIQGRALAKLRTFIEQQELIKSVPAQRIRQAPTALGV